MVQSVVVSLESMSQKLSRKNTSQLQETIHQLKTDSDENFWNEFSLRFSEVRPGFFMALQKKFPDITPSEKKLSALLHLNLNTKEIAAITYQSPDSVKVARSRLRKKLGLKPGQNLIGFLTTI